MPLVAFAVTLNANRQVTGVLRGFDQFMNLVLDATVDEKMKTDIGMVVSVLRFLFLFYEQELNWLCCNGAGHPGEQHCHNRGTGEHSHVILYFEEGG